MLGNRYSTQVSNGGTMYFNFDSYNSKSTGRECCVADCKGKTLSDATKSTYCSLGHFNVGTGWTRPKCECGADKSEATKHAYWCDVTKWEGA